MQNKFKIEGLESNIEEPNIEMTVTIHVINRNKSLQFIETYIVANSEQKKIKRKRNNKYNNQNKKHDFNFASDPGKQDNLCENIISTVHLDT